MTKFGDERFSVAVNSGSQSDEEFRKNWDRIFGVKVLSKREPVKECSDLHEKEKET